MTPQELAEIGSRLYGRRWQTKMAKALHVNVSTVGRWARGKVSVPGPAVAALKCFDRERNAKK